MIGRSDEAAEGLEGQHQFRTDKWTFLHDRRVVEIFHEGVDGSTRFHVDHLRIDGRLDGADLKVKWGIEVSGTIVNGGRMTIPAHQVNDFNAFVQRALTYRTDAT